jgi:phosphate-selective porin OprO and OprP
MRRFACRPLLSVLVWVVVAGATAQAEGTARPTDATPTPTIGTVADEHRAQRQPTPAGPVAPGERPVFEMHLYWERGLNYTARQRVWLGRDDAMLFDEDASLTGRIGLKTAVDVAGFFEDGSLPHLGTRVDLRRALFYTTGEFRFLVPIQFKFDLGGVGDELYFSDFYLWARDVPYVGTIKVGQFDAPMSLEALTGSTYETFMEYGSPVEAFAPGLKVGVQIADSRADQRATWAYGIFTDGQDPDVGDASKSVARLTGRCTWLAVQPAAPADTLIHLGSSASWVLSSRDRIRYDSRPESYLAPDLVSTGDLDTDDAFLFGLELAAKRGPATLQFEYLAAAANASEFGSLYFDGMYGSASWFVTGEQRPYDASVARMGPLVPTHDLAPWHGHWGAWELAGRASWLDLSDGPIRGGRMLIFTGGVNWYWNRYVRILFNANLAHTYDGPDDGHLGILQSRFQLAF